MNYLHIYLYVFLMGAMNIKMKYSSAEMTNLYEEMHIKHK